MRGLVQCSIKGLQKCRLDFCNLIYMSSLVDMSVLNVEPVFFFCLWKYMFSFSSYRINCIHVYIWFHPLCTACAIVLFWILFQTLLSFNMLGCYRSQSLSASCTTSAICARSQTALGTCHKWSSLGICCKSAAVPCMPSWISWFWHPHSHVAVASTFLG